MALTITELKLPITVQQAHSILTSHTQRMGVFLDLDRCYELIGILKMENVKLLKKLRELCGDLRYKPENTLETLVSMGVSRRDLKLKNKDSVSSKVLNPLIESGDYDYNEELVEFMSTYLKYSSNVTNIGTLNGYTQLPRCRVLSWNGHRMVLARPSYSILSTSRLQTSDPNMQGIARNFGDLVTYPAGYILIRADSGQIEPRINFSYFLRDDIIVWMMKEYKDAYYAMLVYCTISDEVLEGLRNGTIKELPPKVESDDFKTKRQTIKTLTNAGSYGSHHLGNVDPTLASSFDRRIVKHPARLAKEREVAKQVAMGNTTFYGAFGSPVTPGSTAKHKEGSDTWENHLMNCGVNNPVQTTASELMICSVNAANKLLIPYANSAICYYKHDEGAFLIHEDDAAKCLTLVDELSDITAYNVLDWVPIEADAVIGMKKPTRPSYL